METGILTYLILLIIPLIIGIVVLRKSNLPKSKYWWLILILMTSYLGLIVCLLFIKRSANISSAENNK